MTITAIVSFLVVLTVLVFVHEMGHYLIARKNGVRVEVFCVLDAQCLPARVRASVQAWGSLRKPMASQCAGVLRCLSAPQP